MFEIKDKKSGVRVYIDDAPRIRSLHELRH